MRTRFSHTQPGYVVLAGVGAALALILYLGVAEGPHPILLAVAVVLGLVVVNFRSLTVEVDDTSLTAWFGTGLVRRRIPLVEIASARVVRNPLYYGFGIRWIPGGWMFNVSGRAAVELELRTGERFRVGTDTPFLLAEALESRGVTRHRGGHV